MMQRVDIVRADSCHIGQIAEIESSCIPGGWSEQAFAQALENENSLMYAAVCGENTAGFLNGSYVLDEAELLNIAVSKEYRRCGIAVRLYNEFENRLLKLGVKIVYLEVRESNIAAERLYSKLGFERSGFRKNYYRSPSENAVLMMKKL